MKRTIPETPTALPDATEVPSAPAWSPWVQGVVSVVLALHLAAVFLGPMRFAAGPSPAVAPLTRLFDPYINLLYLNHGYAFFAPNVGPNHLVRYELEFADGREPLVGEFPDRQEQWPRLLYHRHFMLAETLYRLAPPPLPPAPRGPIDDSSAARRVFERQNEAWQADFARWKTQHALYHRARTSVANHLRHDYQASEVRLVLREHRPLDLIEFTEDRVGLRDKQTYIDLPEIPDIAEELPWNPEPSR